MDFNTSDIQAKATVQAEKAEITDSSIPEIVSPHKIIYCPRCLKLYPTAKRLQRHIGKNQFDLHHGQVASFETQISSL